MIICYNYSIREKEMSAMKKNKQIAESLAQAEWKDLERNAEEEYPLTETTEDDINLTDNQAVASTTKWWSNNNGTQPVSPTRHNYSHDSRDRIKFLKDMVGHEVPDSFDPHEISWVLPNLGVTGSEGAEEAIDKGYFVINVAGELMNDATVKMPIEPSNGTWGRKRDSTVLQTLESIVNTMEMAKASQQKVVVHCSMGMERSVLATVWYLLRNKGMSLDNAYNFVRSVRPIATDRRTWLIE